MNQNITNTITIIITFLTLLTTIFTLVKEWLDLKKVKHQLGEIQVVANANEMKNALAKPLEGSWRVSGNFEKYQGIDVTHRSSGYADFWWDHDSDRYNVVYSYSVGQEYTEGSCITAICYGHAFVTGSEANQQLILRMRIERRTSSENIPAPRSSDFELRTVNNIQIQRALRELEFSFHTDATDGTITFSR